MSVNKKIQLKYAFKSMPNKINTTEMEFETFPWKVESLALYYASTEDQIYA